MKSFIVVAVASCLIAATQAVDQEFVKNVKQHMVEVMQDCAKEVNAGPADIDALMAYTIPASHEGKCILFCVHKHFNGQNEDGSGNLQGALASLEPIKDVDADIYNKLVETFTACDASVAADADPCIFAANFGLCLQTTGKAKGLDKDIMS